MATNRNIELALEEARNALGISCLEELFIEPSDEVLRILNAKETAGEFKVNRRLRELTHGGAITEGSPCFMGSGVYDRFVPTSVEKAVSQGDVYTAYTSVRPEASLSVLRALVEYRETVLRLTDMNYVNASFYCGGSVLARACLLAVETTGRGVVLASATLDPDQLTVLRAYAEAQLFELRVIPECDGTIDVDALTEALTEVGEEAAALVLQYPNFFGLLERVTQIVRRTKEIGALTIAYADTIALSVLNPPCTWGADIVVGDGVPQASPMGFTSCRLGFLTLADWLIDLIPKHLLRTLVDRDGVEKTGFLLRRSCGTAYDEKRVRLTHTRETLDATVALTYWAYVEVATMRAAVNESLQLARYAREAFKKAGFEFCHDLPFLYEFGVKVDDPHGMNAYLRKWGVIGGYELDDGILFAFTEKRSPEEVDELIYFMQAYLRD